MKQSIIFLFCLLSVSLFAQEQKIGDTVATGILTHKIRLSSNKGTGVRYAYFDEQGRLLRSTRDTALNFSGGGGGSLTGGSAGKFPIWTSATSLSYISALTWDSVNQRMGINTDAPERTFHLKNGAMLLERTIDDAGVIFRQTGVASGLAQEWVTGVSQDRSFRIRNSLVGPTYTTFKDILSLDTFGNLKLWKYTGAGNRLMAFDANGSVYATTVDPATLGSQWTTSGSDIYYATGNVRIGSTGVGSAQLHIEKDQNTSTGIRVQNASTGTGADAAISLYNSASDFGYLKVLGSGYTTTASWQDAMVLRSGGGLSGGLKFSAAAGGMRFSTSGTETSDFAISATGVLSAANLAGADTRMVVASSTGVLSTQAIPSGSGTTYTFSSEFTNSSNNISINAIAQSNITNLTTDLAAKAPLASPALTGTPTAPTAAAGTSTTQIATTAFVTNGLAEKQGTLTLTTTGTSGAATLIGNTLNIPNYATGSGGEANTASNLGSGTGIFAQKVDADLQFKSLVPGTNTTITSDANTVTIAIPGDLTTFTPRFSGGSGQGDANIAIPVGQLFVYLNEISVASNLTVGFSTSSTSGSQTLHHVIANTNTNATYNWQYSATVKKADGTTVTEIPKGKTHTLFYIPTGAYWLLASEY